MLICPNCGEYLEGDGYTVAFHCPNYEDEDRDFFCFEPDSYPVYCSPEEQSDNL